MLETLWCKGQSKMKRVELQSYYSVHGMNIFDRIIRIKIFNRPLLF